MKEWRKYVEGVNKSGDLKSSIELVAKNDGIGAVVLHNSPGHRWVSVIDPITVRIIFVMFMFDRTASIHRLQSSDTCFQSNSACIIGHPHIQ